MKKTKKTFRLGALLLIVCLVSTVMLSGTFAKYTSEYAGQDTALVARWQFKVTDGTTDLNAGGAPSQALDLFSHAYATNINQKDGADYIIAPGVRDDFTVKMTFLSDVDAKVTVDFTKAGTVTGDLPIEYSIDDGANWVTLANLPNAFASKVVSANPGLATTASNNTFTFVKSAIPATADLTPITQKVNWRWAFNAADQDGNDALVSSDTTDTGFGNTSALGGATRTTYILNVSVKAEQIQPVAAAKTSINSIAAIIDDSTPQVNETITAGALDPIGATVAYQWQISNAAGDSYTNIPGATSSNYTLVLADQGKKIRVVATGIGSYSGTVTSNSTVAVAAET